MNDTSSQDVEILDMDNLNPDLNSHVIKLTAGVEGRIYKFKIRAYNYNGDYVDTNYVSVALASLPDKPITPPISDP